MLRKQLEIEALTKAKERYLANARELMEIAPSLAVRASASARECELKARQIEVGLIP